MYDMPSFEFLATILPEICISTGVLKKEDLILHHFKMISYSNNCIMSVRFPPTKAPFTKCFSIWYSQAFIKGSTLNMRQRQRYICVFCLHVGLAATLLPQVVQYAAKAQTCYASKVSDHVLHFVCCETFWAILAKNIFILDIFLLGSAE